MDFVQSFTIWSTIFVYIFGIPLAQKEGLGLDAKIFTELLISYLSFLIAESDLHDAVD